MLPLGRVVVGPGRLDQGLLEVGGDAPLCRTAVINIIVGGSGNNGSCVREEEGTQATHGAHTRYIHGIGSGSRVSVGVVLHGGREGERPRASARER